MRIGNIKKNLGNFINRKSKTKIQTERLENYSELLLDILEQYANEIDSSILAYNRKSTEETMMIKGVRKSSQETTNRKTHMDNVEGIATEIAKMKGLHVGVTRIIARNHDIGHTFLGHSGEWWLSNVKEDYGIGYYVHNALGPAELIYRQGIYDVILERIQEFNPEIEEKELSRIKRSLWLIFDGINAHNGEKTESEFIPDKEKSEAKFREELEGCFIKKGYDKDIVPATIEGCLIRLCDKISYIPYDMVDGIREGIIEKLDGEYVDVLTSLGISEKEIENCNEKRNYESIIRKLQIIFTKDVIQNSTKEMIKMSPEVSKPMHELRNINNRRIVKYAVLQEDTETYPKAIKKLMEEFSTILLEDDNIEALKSETKRKKLAEKLMPEYEGKPYEGFARYIAGVSDEEYAYTTLIVSEAIEQSTIDEQEKARQIILSGENFIPSQNFPNRDARIQKYIEYYRNIGIDEDYPEESKKEDVDQVLNEQTDEEFKKKLGLEFGAKYLATLNDFEFFDLLKNTGLISKEQEKSLTRKYKDIGPKGLESEIYVQKEFGEIMKSQVEETEKIPSQQENDEGDER